MIITNLRTVLLATFVILASQSTNVLAQATKVCFGANITRVGSTGATPPPPATPTNSGFRIEVSGGSCSFAANTPFFIDPNIATSGLAIALSAFALKKTVTMLVPDPPIANSLIFRMHVDN